MKRKDLILRVLRTVESNSCGTPAELEEYKVNGNVSAIAALQLDEHFAMDELDYIEFIMELEDDLEINIPDDALPDWYIGTLSIDEVVDALSKGLVQVED